MQHFPAKRGWLTKQGRVRKSWKRRYFVLRDGALLYFEKEDDVVPKGSMKLWGAAVILVGPPKVSRPFCVEVSTPDRSMFIAADDRDTIKDWAQAIQQMAIAASGGPKALRSQRLEAPPAAKEASSAHMTAASLVTEAAARATVPMDDDNDGPGASAGAGQTRGETAAAAAATTISASKPAESAERKNEEKKDKDKPAPPPPQNEEEDVDEREGGGEEVAEVVDVAADGVVEERRAPGAEDEVENSVSSESSDDGDMFEREEEKKAAMRKEVHFTAEEKLRFGNLISEVFRANQAAWDGARKERVKAAKKDLPKKWEASKMKVRKSIKGHSKKVNVVARGPAIVASGGEDTSVRVTNIDTYASVAVLEGHTGVIKAIIVDGKDNVFSGDDRGHVKHWSLDNQTCRRTFTTSTGLGVDAMAITDDGRLLVTASDTTVQVWDVEGGRCVLNHLTGHGGRISSCVLAGNTLFTGSEDHTIRVWNMERQCELLTTLEGHVNWVFCMALTQDKLISGSENIKVWDLAAARKGKCKCNTTLKKPHNAPSVQTLAVSDDERFLVSASMDGFHKVWELGLSSRSKPIAELENKTKFLFSVVLHGRKMFSADRAQAVKVWFG